MDGQTIVIDAEIGLDWRRGSVVRTSVFGWQTFSDLWLTHFVGKVSSMDQPTRPTHPHPSMVGK